MARDGPQGRLHVRAHDQPFARMIRDQLVDHRRTQALPAHRDINASHICPLAQIAHG